MTHHPYLQITLSTAPLGLEERDGEVGRNTTCQYVLGKRARTGSVGRSRVKDDVARELLSLEEGDVEGKARKSKKTAGREENLGAPVKGQKRKSEGEAGPGGGKRAKGTHGINSAPSKV